MEKKRPPSKRLIFSVHGIRTIGRWQADIANDLEDNGWKHVPFRFGYFSLLRFFRNSSRQHIIEEFHDWYIGQCMEHEPRENRRALYRPSIVAHSFGSLVVGECMLKYREVKFDKIILCGSILPREFDWALLLARNQVWNVRNEFGLRDRWAKIAGDLSGQMGDSGHRGFDLHTACVVQEQFNYHEHSDYFRLGHCKEHWLPFLNRKSLQVTLRRGRELSNEEYDSALRQAHQLSDECYAHLPGYDGGLSAWQ